MVNRVTGYEKGKRSLLALLVALVVAVVGAYLLSLSTVVKPAEAATTCSSAASVPKRVFVGSTPYVQFFASIKCSAPVRDAYMDIRPGQQNSSGVWEDATEPGSTPYARGWFGKSQATYTATLRLRCSTPYVSRPFRTYSIEPKVQAMNGKINVLPNRVSSPLAMKC